MPRQLPPHVSEADFAAALAGFAAAIGKQWVFAEDADVDSYLDAYSIGDPAEHQPAAAIAPKSVEEIQAVLKIANRYKIPLWPVSKGKNFAYGGAAPRMAGTVVLDLKRMNQILEINEEVGYALVEPGVGFFELHEALEKRGGALWMSGAAHSWGSVIGNALEHGVGYTPYGVHADAICGMEVVLATGEVIRTGMGATAGSKEWQVYKNSFGPIWDGAFTQSNFGIVTKMGIWLMPAPGAMAGVRISCANESDLPLLVDTLRPLRLNDTINATYTIANGVRMAHRAGLRANIYTGKDSIPRGVVGAQLAKQGDGWWSVIFNLFDNSVAGVDLRIAAIQAAFAKLPGAKVDVRQRWAKGQPQASWMRQEVSLGPLGVVDWYGGRGGHTDFGPVMVPVGSRVSQVYDLVYKRFGEHGIDCYVGMFGLGQRAIVMVADIIYDRDDDDMVTRARALFRQLCKDAAAIGITLYRSHITFMDDAAAMLTYNDKSFMRFNERVKAALDPNGILAPGKQGIWPAAYKDRP